MTDYVTINKEVFAKRFSDLLKNSEHTIYSIGKIVNLSGSTISRYANGNMAPKSPTVDALAKIFDVNYNWLSGCNVPKTRYMSRDEIIAKRNIIPIDKVKKIPLLGVIACGEPILAEENIEEYILLPDKLSADFALRCKGDSMINARIKDGDIVYIHQQPTVDNGEIAAVLIDDEATLKRVFIYKDKIVLQAENPKYEPFVYIKEEMQEVKILGKAVGFTSLI